MSDILAKFLTLFFALILVLLPFHAFLSTWGGTVVGPLLVWKSWKEILLIILLIPVAIYLFMNRDLADRLWRRAINKFVIIYAIITVIWALFSSASMTAIVAGLAFNLRFFAMFLLAQVLLESKNSWIEKVKLFAAPVLLWVTVIISLFAILQVTVLPHDFLVSFGYDKDSSIAPFILVDDNPEAVRAFSTLRGPNTLAAFLVLPLILALALFVAKKQRWLAAITLALGGIALLLTGARSAWLGFAAALICLLLLELPKQKLLKVIKWGALPGFLLIAGFIWLATTVPALRLAVFHSSPGDPTLVEGSTEDHWHATTNGIKDVIANPVGTGVGSAGPASFYSDKVKLAENYFVQIAQETGVVGIGLFIAIYLLMFRRLLIGRAQLWHKVLLASLVGLTVVNIFLHGWADDPTAMVWWAFAGLFAWPVIGGKKS